MHGSQYTYPEHQQVAASPAAEALMKAEKIIAYTIASLGMFLL